MNGWQEVKLGQFVKSISDTYKFKPNEQVVFLNTSDILLGRVINHALQNSANLPGQAKKRIKKGDFLFSEIRPANGRYAMIDFDVDNYVVSTKLMVLRCNEQIDSIFFRLFLTSKEQLEYLQMLAEDRSGTFPQITFDHISNLDIFLPPIPEQRAIAAVLSSLDDKIDLLHRQNKTLEAMAETLFRQWFIEEAQDDWKEYSIFDFADHIKSNVVPAKSSNELFHHYSLPAFDDGKRPTVELGSEILSNKYKVVNNSILVSKLNPRVPRIWPIGELQSKNAVCSTEFQVFKPKSGKLYGYLYFLLRSSDAVDSLTMAASGTSGSHQRVKPEDILNIKTNLPSIEHAELYSNLVLPGINKTQSNLVQIKTLEKLRDTLLSKLMSGEVKVSMQENISRKYIGNK